MATVSLLAFGLSGCATATSLTPLAEPHLPVAGVGITGQLNGGQQPVANSQVFLYAAGQGGLGSGATSLLKSPGYVTTDTNGNFSITNDYTCPTGAYVYLLALGGNPGLASGANNTQLALASGVGACSSLTASSSFNVNEVTTVATAFALAGFGTSETQIGAPASAPGLANAFGNISNLVNLGTGVALSSTPAGNGLVPQAELNSLANALAACVNSTGVGAPCNTLMIAAGVSAGSGTPIDTFQAALNIAHNPGNNVSTIFGLATPNLVFQPTLPQAPNDWTITVQYAGKINPTQVGKQNPCSAVTPASAPITDICVSQGIAVDATGNIWISNRQTPNLAKFSPAGAELSPPGGYTSPSLNAPQQIGIDMSGNVWATSRAFTSATNLHYADSVQKFSSTGTLLSGVNGFTGAGLSTPRALALDVFGNVWAGGSGELSVFNTGGSVVAGPINLGMYSIDAKMAFDRFDNAWMVSFDPNNGNSSLTEYAAASNTYFSIAAKSIQLTSGSVPQGVAVDPANNIWVSDFFTQFGAGNGDVVEYSNAGALLSPSLGYTAGGIANPGDVVIDGSGTVFTAQSQIGKISSTGAGLATSSGFQNPNPNDCCLVAAIDNSGSLWLTGGSYLYQMVGLAAPVVTPTVANLLVPMSLTFTPASTSLSQLGQQTFTAIVNGASVGSFLFTTTGTAGLIGPAGTGSPSKSYCSANGYTGNMTVYYPTASPMLTSTVTETVTMQAFAGANCIPADSYGSASATVTVMPAAQAQVIVTPATASLAQTDQQVYVASIPGLAIGGYRWSTTATAGTLGDPGSGGSVTGKTSYCSLSSQTLYTPNATTRLTSDVTDTITVTAYNEAGCGSSSMIGTSPATPVTVRSPTDTLAIPGFATKTYTSTVVLPSGSTLSPQQLTVIDSVSEAFPSASGNFSMSAYDFGSQIALVLSPAGNPMMMGWLDATHSQITAGSTAEVLAFYALGGALMYTESDKNALEASILNASGLPALTQVVAQEIAGNPDAFANPDAALTSALNNFFTSVSGITPHSVGGSVHAHGILISPGQQSGENVIQLPPFQAEIMNTYRRRSQMFLTRIGDTPTGDPSTPVPVLNFEVPPVTGLTGGVAGTISDIYNAYWGNSTTAYAPVYSDAFNIPLQPGDTKTTYQVTVVGPGPGNLGLIPTLSIPQQGAQVQVSVYGFVYDALIPFYTNFVFGSGFPPGKTLPTATVQVQAFLPNWQLDLANDLYNALTTTPAIQTMIVMGDYKGAFASVVDSIRQGGTFRNVLIASVNQAAGKGFISSTVTAALQVFNGLLNAAGGALQIFDSAVYAAQLTQSDAVDQWTVVVTNQKVTLSPATTSLPQYGAGFQLLTANVPGADTTGYSYYWTNTGTAGDLVPVSGSGTAVNSGFCSSSNQQDYVVRPTPALTLTTIDTITVKAYTGAGCVAANVLGPASATVTVIPLGAQLNPPNPFIAQTGSQALVATVPGATSTAGYSYLWSTTGSVGTLTEVGGNSLTKQTSYCSSSPHASYMPNPTPQLLANASDTVSVQAFSAAGCASGSIGQAAKATITITASTLLLQPRNVTIGQNETLPMYVTVSGSSAGLSFQWSTLAAVGLLNEQGGQNRVGQTAYCSPSLDATYVPYSSPAIVSSATDTVTVQAFSSSTCTANTAVSNPVTTGVTVAVPIQTLPTPLMLNGIVQAWDGNFYGDTPGVSSYIGTETPCTTSTGIAQPCGSNYRITPAGVATRLYDFSSAGGASGYALTGLIQGPDRNFYGFANAGGAMGDGGTFFQVTPAGAFTVLHAFTAADGISDYTYGGPLLHPILGSDGNFYGFSSCCVFKIATTGTVTLVLNLNNQPSPHGGVIQGLIEASDGNFYGATLGGNGNVGTLFQLKPTGEFQTVVYFPGSTPSTEIYGAGPSGDMVQGADGSLYGTTRGYDGSGSPPGPTVWRYKLNGEFETIFSFPTGGGDGLSTVAGLALGTDGNLYGAAYNGGAGFGTLYRVSTGGNFSLLHTFFNGTDGLNPTGPPIIGNDGSLVGTSGGSAVVNGANYGGQIYSLNLGMAPPVQLVVTVNGTVPSTVASGTPFVMNWSVLSAFSNTAQQCYASVQGNPTGAGAWTGKQTGAVASGQYSGTATITPTSAGNYTYALSCGGMQSGYTNLIVK